MIDMEPDLIDRLAVKYDLDPKEVEKVVKAQQLAVCRTMASDTFKDARVPGLGAFKPNDKRITKFLAMYEENPDNAPMRELKDRAKDYIKAKGLWPKPKPNK